MQASSDARTPNQQQLNSLHDHAKAGESAQGLLESATEMGLDPWDAAPVIESGVDKHRRNAALAQIAWSMGYVVILGGIGFALESSRALIFAAFGVLFALFGVIKLLYALMTPTRLQIAPRDDDRGDAEKLKDLIEANSEGRIRSLAWTCGVGSIFVFTIPITLSLYLWGRFWMRRATKSLVELLDNQTTSVEWVYARIQSTYGMQFGTIVVNAIESNGRKRVYQCPMSTGDLNRAIELYYRLYPDALIGHSSENRKEFTARAKACKMKAA